MRRSFPLWALLVTVFACGGGGSGGDPISPPGADRTVASITVSPPSAEVEVGGSVQFTATAQNASGQVVTGVSFTWDVTDPNLASVDANGRATGKAAGTVSVRATASGRTGSASLAVLASSILIETISPAEIAEGQAATIIGDGFSATLADNRVLIGDTPATVTSATETELRITVPIECRPAGPVDVRVSVGTSTSAAFRHPFRPSVGPLGLAAGQRTILQSPDPLCLQFEASAGAERYLLGVQSTIDNVRTLTPLAVRGVAAQGGAAGLAPAFDGRTPGGESPLPRGRLDRLLARHRASESELRLTEERMVRSGRLPIAAARDLAARGRLAPAAVPQVGDRFEVRIPDRLGNNLCAEFVTITVVVREVGEHGIFVEDVTNAPGGLTDLQYGNLSTIFDGNIFETLVDYFGDPTDFDGNGRVVIVLSNQLNRWLEEVGAVAFVTATDLFPRLECPSSNEGEFYFSIAPDPGGQHGRAFSVEDIFNLQQILVAHETTHTIQFGRRLQFPGATAFLNRWQAEGQATLAEEVVGFAIRGRSTGRNYGPEVIFEELPIQWHLSAFFDLVTYFGFRSPDARVIGAPERCSFLGVPLEGNDGPCIGNLAYGVSWSFLRWLSDQFGPERGGGEQAIHRAIIDNASSGFTTIEQVVGVPRETLLMMWAASLFADDRIPGVDPRLTWSSWDLFGIEQGVVETARLQPRSRAFADFEDQVSVRAGSTAYFLMGGAPRSAASFRVRNPAGGGPPPFVQVWVVRIQ